jgi:hypothetical protein
MLMSMWKLKKFLKMMMNEKSLSRSSSEMKL